MCFVITSSVKNSITGGGGGGGGICLYYIRVHNLRKRSISKEIRIVQDMNILISAPSPKLFDFATPLVIPVHILFRNIHFIMMACMTARNEQILTFQYSNSYIDQKLTVNFSLVYFKNLSQVRKLTAL